MNLKTFSIRQEEASDSHDPNKSDHFFWNNYDHLDHGKNDVTNAMEDIIVKDHHKFKKDSTGRKCHPFDWVTAHYTTSITGGHQV